MLPQWIIEKKRDGSPLSDAQISSFISGYAAGTIPDYQAAALAMAILWRGMSIAETAALTRALRDSGRILKIPGGPKIDKHSTGGIGDKISLILAPLVAAGGLSVPMISGRGLGITGGTLDKLEAIPGFRVRLKQAEIIRVLRACGCCLIGQSELVAPADGKLYALRDVTGTVPSVPLIVSSILSKKLAAGLDGLVMDVKCGAGAFMQTPAEARQLAKTLLQVGRQLGLRMAALITAMHQPLGRKIGNALEVQEAIEVLQGQGPADVRELTLELGAHMLSLGNLAPDLPTARELLQAKLASGAALTRFKDMLRLQGGDARIVEQPQLLPQAPIQEAWCAPRQGFIRRVDAAQIGKACLVLGAGRTRVTNPIDHAVGLSGLKKIGEAIQRHEPLAIIHARDKASLAAARELLREAISYSARPPPGAPLILAQMEQPAAAKND